MTEPTRPPVALTALVLTLGTLASAGLFLFGLALTMAGADTSAGDPMRLGEVLAAALELRPWGWSMLGVLVLLLTPAAGLAVSVAELRRLQPRTAVLAMGVLWILLAAALIALLAD